MSSNIVPIISPQHSIRLHMHSQHADGQSRPNDCKFFDSNYCGVRLSVATFGSESLEYQLQRLQDVMADIDSGKEHCAEGQPSHASPPPFPDDRLGQFMMIKGTTSDAMLWIHFPVAENVDESHTLTPISGEPACLVYPASLCYRLYNLLRIVPPTLSVWARPWSSQGN